MAPPVEAPILVPPQGRRIKPACPQCGKTDRHYECEWDGYIVGKEPALPPLPLAKECLGRIATTHDALLTLRICRAILRPALVRDLLLNVAGDLPEGHARLLLERAADGITSGGQTDTTVGRIEQAIELLKEG